MPLQTLSGNLVQPGKRLAVLPSTFIVCSLNRFVAIILLFIVLDILCSALVRFYSGVSLPVL